MKQGKTLVLAITILALLIHAWALGAQGQARNGRENGGTCLLSSTTVNQPLSEVEISWLLQMREEEKLARDVYTKLYQDFGLIVFDRISKSEQTHFDAIKNLLDRYNIAYPKEDNVVGIFANENIQSSYDELTSNILSAVEALNVGVSIESLDISDLEEALVATEHKDIDRVYANLLEGSFNHLDAFESHLQALGE
jgi:hypothetical protein